MGERAAKVSMVSGVLDDTKGILARAETHDGSSPVSDQAILAVSQGQRELFLFRERQEGPGVSGVSGSEHDGTEHSESAQGGRELTDAVAVGVIGQGELDLVVDPEHRGRGIGSAALELLLAHHRAGGSAGADGSQGTGGSARERDAAGDGKLLAWAHGENPAANALLARANFTPVRSLYRMALDPELLPPAGTNVPLPAGFSLRNFDPARPGDAEAWVRVNATAFATHPEQGRITVQDFALMREEPWYDDADLLLLEADHGAGSRLVGYTWVKTLRDAGGDGTSGDGTETELYAVGVDPEYAGQGLGKVLLDVTLARMAGHAPSRVTLYVDGENERAVRMYESAKFTIDSRSRQWEVGETG